MDKSLEILKAAAKAAADKHTPNGELAARVLQTIIDSLEQGPVPASRHWEAGRLPNGKP